MAGAKGGKSGQQESTEFHEAFEKVRVCVQVIDDKKGESIVVLDTRRATFIDYLVIATVQSGRQLKAIADEIDRALKRCGRPARGIEGTPKSGWILLDAGDFVVHLFLPQTRAYYDLEMLWGDVPRIDVAAIFVTRHVS